MKSSPTVENIKYVGLDVHAETIAVTLADSSATDTRFYGNIPSHSHSVDRLLKKLSTDGSTLRFVYEAGPTGFWLARYLRSKGFDCQVVCPSLIPKKASDRVKTDRRDSDALARLFRAGELSFVCVPDETDEAIRDLVRTRQRAVEDLRRCRQRIKAFMLRYGRRYSGKSSWTAEHLNYLSRQNFDHRGQQIAFEELLQSTNDPTQRIKLLTQVVLTEVKTWSRFPLVQALMCLRGMGEINAITWVAEIGDIARFNHPSQLMSFIGLTPAEDSSGQRRCQGPITKAGNSACRRATVEAAWQYRLPARITPTIRQRHHNQPKAVTDIAWNAQVRLCQRYRDLIGKRKKTVVAVTAVARELVGFIWSIAHAMAPYKSDAAKPIPNPVPAPQSSNPSRTQPQRRVREYQLDSEKVSRLSKKYFPAASKPEPALQFRRGEEQRPPTGPRSHVAGREQRLECTSGNGSTPLGTAVLPLDSSSVDLKPLPNPTRAKKLNNASSAKRR